MWPSTCNIHSAINITAYQFLSALTFFSTSCVSSFSTELVSVLRRLCWKINKKQVTGYPLKIHDLQDSNTYDSNNWVHFQKFTSVTQTRFTWKINGCWPLPLVTAITSALTKYLAWFMFSKIAITNLNYKQYLWWISQSTYGLTVSWSKLELEQYCLLYLIALYKWYKHLTWQEFNHSVFSLSPPLSLYMCYIPHCPH